MTLNESHNPAPGLVVRIENVVRALDRQLTDEHDRVDELTTEIERPREQLGQPFKHRDWTAFPELFCVAAAGRTWRRVQAVARERRD
jgi:hypothetical protein